jgi:hypothetical protein
VGRDLLGHLLELVVAGAGIEQALDEHPQALSMGGAEAWPRSDLSTSRSRSSALIQSASSCGSCSQKIGDTHDTATYSG